MLNSTKATYLSNQLGCQRAETGNTYLEFIFLKQPAKLLGQNEGEGSLVILQNCIELMTNMLCALNEEELWPEFLK